MSFIDHLRTCTDCQRREREYHNIMADKPTIRFKGASYNRTKKLSELAAIITGRSYGILSSATEKGASVLCNDNRSKLKELGKMIKGL